MPPSPRRADDTAGLASAIVSRTAHVVHLTHNDLDAVGADAIHRMKFGKDGVFTVWSSVGKFAGLFSLIASCPGKGDLLSISDLGCQRDLEAVTVRARSNGWVIEWRDHHRWREEETAAIRKTCFPPSYRYRCLRNRDRRTGPCPGEPGRRRGCQSCLRLRPLETCRSPFRRPRAGTPEKEKPGPCP